MIRMGLRDLINLNEIGYKEVAIRGEKFLVFWNKHDSYSNGGNSPEYYRGFTSYAYQADGEIKTANFVSVNIDKETAWENLIDDIDRFLKKIKSKY